MNAIATDPPPAKRLRFVVRRCRGAFGRRAKAAACWPFLQTALLALILLSPLPTHANRNTLKPSDFVPLTGIPWKEDGATMESVLEALFRETNRELRYSMLGVYLRELPVENLAAAFDRCVDLEGTETPDQLVALLLEVWGERDPVKGLERTKQLFAVVGIREGWLHYLNWTGRPKITVQDFASLRGSRFWLTGWSLAWFPVGVERSSLHQEDRNRIMKEFAGIWIEAFGTWPGAYPNRDNYPGATVNFGDVLYTLDSPVDRFEGITPSSRNHDELAYEIGVRRWMFGKPRDGAKIVMATATGEWPAQRGRFLEPPGPSTELLMIWARGDLPGMIRWADSLKLTDKVAQRLARQVRGFLMSRVDDKTRQRWLAAAKTSGGPGELWKGWAAWDPAAAIAAVVKTGDPSILSGILEAAVNGPFKDRLYNTSHHGLGVIKDFDVSKLPGKLHDGITEEWPGMVTERWGQIDVGETARYGVDYLVRNHYVPRESLLEFFSGNDENAPFNDLLIHTFCALRVWAVVRPQEMKPWIATLEDEEMRKALTWLLENPWGGPKE